MSVRAMILLASVTALGGCVAGAVGAAGAVGISAAQDRTMGESLDDANASNELKSKLFAAGPRRFQEVDVEVAGGTVLLTGRVSSPIDKAEAEQLAWSVRLADEVFNEIVVREPGGARQNLNDEWITARVRSRLLTDSGVKSININIETYDGVVYLMGIARSQAELQRAAEHASYVRGVKEVVSYMEIRNPSDTRAPAVPQYETAPAAPQDTVVAVPLNEGTEQELLGGPEGF